MTFIGNVHSLVIVVHFEYHFESIEWFKVFFFFDDFNKELNKSKFLSLSNVNIFCCAHNLR